MPWRNFLSRVFRKKFLCCRYPIFKRTGRKKPPCQNRINPSNHFNITHLVTHLVWPHQPENPPRRPRAQRISPRRSPSLFPLSCWTIFNITPTCDRQTRTDRQTDRQMAVAIVPALTKHRCRVRDANVLGLEKKLGKTVCSTDYPDSLDCLSIILNLSISVFLLSLVFHFLVVGSVR